MNVMSVQCSDTYHFWTSWVRGRERYRAAHLCHCTGRLGRSKTGPSFSAALCGRPEASLGWKRKLRNTSQVSEHIVSVEMYAQRISDVFLTFHQDIHDRAGATPTKNHKSAQLNRPSCILCLILHILTDKKNFYRTVISETFAKLKQCHCCCLTKTYCALVSIPVPDKTMKW